MLPQAMYFKDESEALYELLLPLQDADFQQPTGFKDWTANHIIGHLYLWNQAALDSLTDESRFQAFLAEAMSAFKGGGLFAFEAQRRGDLAGHALLEAWRDHYLSMAEQFRTMDPKARLKWAGPDMSARSSITARLMETWAHGQALYDLLNVRRQDTDRIGNIAVLGVNTFGWTFKNRNMDVPPRVPAVRLTAPSGDTWEWHADNPDDRIEGAATEFCQVVTQTRNIADTELAVTGEIAHQWMAIAQCFAGPPEDPPPPGTRGAGRP